MEGTFAAPAPPAQSSALSAQATPKKNTASQPPPRNIATAAQNSIERAAATTAPKDIVTAAQYSLERAIAATSTKDFVTAQESKRVIETSSKPTPIYSLETAVPFDNDTHKAMKPTAGPSQGQAETTSVTYVHQSLEKALTNSTTQQTVVAAQRSKAIVTPQGTWTNVAPPSVPQETLPAVQNFLLMAFERVQQSQQAKSAPNNTSQQSASTPPTQAASPLTPTSGPTPLSPQTATPTPFRSLQRANSQPNTNLDMPKLQTLPDKNAFQIKKTTSTEASTSLEQTPSSSELKKAPSLGPASRSQSFPGYTFYNTTRQSSPKQAVAPPQRSVLVAKRQNPVSKAPETGNSVQCPASDILLANLTPKAQNLNSPQKKNTGQSPKNSPVKHNSSRVAQTFKESRERGASSPQTSHSVKGQNAQNAGVSNRNFRRLKPNELEGEEIDPKRRVLVLGFPAYTQSQDLIRVLSRFGKCHVDSCRNRLAVVTFDKEADAESAVRATDDINIYGEFVEIKPFTTTRQVADLYRAYKKVISTAHKGEDIIMPSNIDLSGDFFQQLDNIQNAIRLTREQVQAVTNLYVDLELVLQQEWPGCVAIPFGSIPTGLGIKSSDADCYVELPERLRARGAASGAATFVPRARRLLQYYPKMFTNLVAIPRANTPIVKFRHVASGFHCDVSAKTPLGAQNSKLIKLLLEHDARLAPLAVLLKYWAKVHDLSGTGRLTNYALTMMVVFYLQQPAVALVPAVERLQRDRACDYIVDHWNAGFSPRKLPAAGARPDAPALPDLLGGFFDFYATFDFEQLVVCPYLGAAVPKLAFDAPHLLPAQFARYAANVRDNLASPLRHATPFCVQDPFEQSHNVASSVGGKLAGELRAYFRFAAAAYAADRAGGCRNLLRTVLLTRPRLRAERVTPATSVALLPRVRGAILAPDWRAVVRDLVLDAIFDKILKLQLKRDEKDARKESSRRPTRFFRERYFGAATKPVWRRKKALIHISATESPEELVSRQAALTDDILAGGAAAALEFELELWFRDEPRTSSVSCRLTDGDMDAFRQFVTFLHTFMLDWFRALLRPHLAPAPEEGAEALRAEAAERAAAEAGCAISFERRAARAPSPPRLVLEPGDVARDLRALALAPDSDSSDGSKEPR